MNLYHKQFRLYLILHHYRHLNLLLIVDLKWKLLLMNLDFHPHQYQLMPKGHQGTHLYRLQLHHHHYLDLKYHRIRHHLNLLEYLYCLMNLFHKHLPKNLSIHHYHRLNPDYFLLHLHQYQAIQSVNKGKHRHHQANHHYHHHHQFDYKFHLHHDLLEYY